MNMKFGKLNLTGGIEYAPKSVWTTIHHHDEWDEEKIDAETGEPTGETEHKVKDWDERKYVLHPTAENYLNADGGPFYEIVNNQPEQRDGFYPVRERYVEVEGHIETEWKYEPIPVTPKTYNKYRLGMAIQSAGLLDALLQFFAANPAYKFHWDNAQDFTDNDENFKAIVAVFVEQFGEDKVAEILKNAEV